jgi:hypothetical protein
MHTARKHGSPTARTLLLAAGIAACGLLRFPADAPAEESDPPAVALAEATLQAMGGADAWSRLHYLTWNFRGRRTHTWDRWSGDVRIVSGTRLVLMNVNSRSGRAWEGGAEITDDAARREALEQGYAWWVNDSYWLIMPAKLLDPGVILRDRGEASLSDGRAADLITVTFEGDTGLTPRNKYDVWFDARTHLVAQWSYYADADNPEPQFTLPWMGWKRFGEVLIATDHGGGNDWEIAAPESLPRSLFERP